MQDNTLTENNQTANSGDNDVNLTHDKQRVTDSNDKNEQNTTVKPIKAGQPGKHRLTRKQKAYADYLLNNPKASHTQAVAHAYDKTTYNTQAVIASENIRKPNIQIYLEEHGYNALADMIEIAKYSKKLGMTGDKSGAAYASVAVAANRDIADRAYGKATQRTEVISKSVSVNIDLTGKLTDEGQRQHRASHDTL